MLLDTNVVSEATRPDPHPGVLDRLAAAEGQAALAAITWHELQFGVRRLRPGRRRDALEEFVRTLPTHYPVLPYDARAADWHAAERARLERIGRPAPFADSMIAATAVSRGLTLVTRNVSDYLAYPGLDLLDWWTPG